MDIQQTSLPFTLFKSLIFPCPFITIKRHPFLGILGTPCAFQLPITLQFTFIIIRKNRSHYIQRPVVIKSKDKKKKKKKYQTNPQNCFLTNTLTVCLLYVAYTRNHFTGYLFYLRIQLIRRSVLSDDDLGGP